MNLRDFWGGLKPLEKTPHLYIVGAIVFSGVMGAAVLFPDQEDPPQVAYAPSITCLVGTMVVALVYAWLSRQTEQIDDLEEKLERSAAELKELRREITDQMFTLSSRIRHLSRGHFEQVDEHAITFFFRDLEQLIQKLERTSSNEKEREKLNRMFGDCRDRFEKLRKLLLNSFPNCEADLAKVRDRALQRYRALWDQLEQIILRPDYLNPRQPG